jgi:hypothetical protein
MQVIDKKRPSRVKQMQIDRKYVVLAILAAVLFVGIVLGDFNETWLNGATL